MKKFYYSKEASQDESSLSFLDHRNRMDVNNEHGRGMSARAASVNSLDLLSEAPTIPRVKARDVTRSMSDVAAKAKPKKQNLITETELSSSWLYKTMQASINSRFKSPRKSPSVHKAGDLEQSILRDPELKPIPVKSKAAKTSSCICHFATMIAISLCTIGFLASIAAIIYMEMFADRNMTSLHAPEAEVDISDVVFDSRDTFNLTTQKLDGEDHILSEALTHRFDGDEEILNEVLKASSTNDIPSLLNKSKNHGRFGDYVTDTTNLETNELRKFINDTNSKIKFQDDVTVIYEMRSEESSDGEVEQNSNTEFKGRSFGFDLNEDTSEDDLEKSTENVKSLEQEQSIDKKLMLNGSELLKNSEDIGEQSSDIILNESKLKEDLKEIVSEFDGMLGKFETNELERNKSAEEIFENEALLEKLNSSKMLKTQDLEKDLKVDTNNNVLHEDDKIDHINEFENDNITQTVKAASESLANFSDIQTVLYEDISQSTLTVKDHSVADDYDVNTMLVTVDDTEASTDSFMPKRNGEINFFPISSPVPSVEPVKQIKDIISLKKPADIKGSLADAMKHLQKLDVNNKILTSRTKPKQKNVQKPKRKLVLNSDEERKRYLQRMRLMLFKHLQ